jgi:hypothetical protein
MLVRLSTLQCLVTATAVALMTACGSYDRASVTIAYGQVSQADEWRLTMLERQRIEDAFKKFSETNGYKCMPNIKRVEEVTCHGPKNINLTFQPSLNKSEFVAKFSWVDSAVRTHHEFADLVSAFGRSIGAVVGESNVTVASND